MSIIEGDRSKGLGVASNLGFPTINLYRKSDDCGVFTVKHDDYGFGVAFVMPELTEIHFFNPVKCPSTYIVCHVLQKIPPYSNGILEYFYKGLGYESDSPSGS